MHGPSDESWGRHVSERNHTVGVHVEETLNSELAELGVRFAPLAEQLTFTSTGSVRSLCILPPNARIERYEPEPGDDLSLIRPFVRARGQSSVIPDLRVE